MKTSIVFIHSAGPQEGDQGSSGLAASLQAAFGSQYECICPRMPEPENPSSAEWGKKIQSELKNLQGEVILIGHSLGGTTLFQHIADAGNIDRVIGMFLLGMPYWGIDEEWQREEFVLPDHFAIQARKIAHLYLYHNRDDEIVPLTHVRHYEKQLPFATLRLQDEGGHLFANGCPQLVRDINSILQRGVD